jgi:hypothetical protein
LEQAAAAVLVVFVRLFQMIHTQVFNPQLSLHFQLRQEFLTQ